ncbi:hypothetical protein C8A05DRAFT_36016, partial [Staphylotrichum tortipilum]
MGTPQIGDVIRLAEIVYTLAEYGWSDDHNACHQFRELGGDVAHLSESLKLLAHVVTSARRSLQEHGQVASPYDLGCDEDSLADIIGDYCGTLNECRRLLDDRRGSLAGSSSSGGTSGPLANIHWNLFVQPQVERLRRRILLHNTKIQHVLRPFEIDLRMRIYRDLAHRIDHVHRDVQAVHHDVRTVQLQLQALMRAFDPRLLPDAEQEAPPQIYHVIVPDDLRHQLQDTFEHHPDRCEGEGLYQPPLRDVSDAFVTSFDKSTRLFQPTTTHAEPPLDQYLALLTSQFLMTRMLEFSEYLAPSPASHWPSYIRSLQKELSKECERFSKGALTPPALGAAPQMPTFWPEDDPPEYIDSVEIPTPMEALLEVPLATESPRRWRNLRLLRKCDGTDRRFRMIITAGDRGQPPRMKQPTDFDIATSTLEPLYTSPDGNAPLELMLSDKKGMHRLAFSSESDLYLFQQAVTGYQVVDEYMESKISVISVIGSSEMVLEHASMQLWRPNRLTGERVMVGDDPSEDGAGRRYSSTSSSDTLRPAAASPTLPPLRSSPQLVTSPHFAAQIRSDHQPQQPSWDNNPSPTDRNPPPLASAGLFIDLNFNPPSTAGPPSRRAPSIRNLFGSSSASSRATQPAPAPPTPPSPQQNRTSRGWGPFYPRHPPDRRATTHTTRMPTPPTPPPARNSRAMSVLSTASTSTTTTRPVVLTGTATTAPTGTLHTMPTEPLLILFTRPAPPNPSKPLPHTTPSIMAITLDHKTTANYRACRCASHHDCVMTALERGSGSGSNFTSSGALKVMRVGRVDVLPLADALRSKRGGLVVSRAAQADNAPGGGGIWKKGVIRVSMCFAALTGRMRFAGLPCKCVVTTEGELMECLALGHRGKLGLVKEVYRRAMVEWNRGRGCYTAQLLSLQHSTPVNMKLLTLSLALLALFQIAAPAPVHHAEVVASRRILHLQSKYQQNTLNIIRNRTTG